MDSYEGDPQSPLSLHKYLYVGADPVNRQDRSGRDFDLGSTIGALAVQASLFVLSVPALVAEAFGEGGGAVGQLFNAIGAAAEGYAAEVLEEAEIELPQIEALPQQPVGQKVIDFVVRNTETAKQLFIEVKYGIPSSASAMSRLVAQMQVFGQAAEETGSDLVLWTLKTPTQAQIAALQSQLPGVEFEVVSGVEALYTSVLNYFQ